MVALGLLLALVALVALPFLLLGAAFKILFVLLTLPFRIVGMALHAVGALLAGVFGLVAGGAGLVLALLVGLVAFVLLPLAPLLLLGAVVWVALKAFSPAPRAV